MANWKRNWPRLKRRLDRERKIRAEAEVIAEEVTLRLYYANQNLEAEQQKSEALLLNVLPSSIAERLKQGEDHIADSYTDVSVLFADVVGFTTLSTKVTPSELLEFLNQIFSAFDALSEKYGLEKIKTIGDAYMLVGGLRSGGRRVRASPLCFTHWGVCSAPSQALWLSKDRMSLSYPTRNWRRYALTRSVSYWSRPVKWCKSASSC